MRSPDEVAKMKTGTLNPITEASRITLAMSHNMSFDEVFAISI